MLHPGMPMTQLQFFPVPPQAYTPSFGFSQIPTPMLPARESALGMPGMPVHRRSASTSHRAPWQETPQALVSDGPAGRPATTSKVEERLALRMALVDKNASGEKAAAHRRTKSARTPRSKRHRPGTAALQLPPRKVDAEVQTERPPSPARVESAISSGSSIPGLPTVAADALPLKALTKNPADSRDDVALSASMSAKMPVDGKQDPLASMSTSAHSMKVALMQSEAITEAGQQQESTEIVGLQQLLAQTPVPAAPSFPPSCPPPLSTTPNPRRISSAPIRPGTSIAAKRHEASAQTSAADTGVAAVVPRDPLQLSDEEMVLLQRRVGSAPHRRSASRQKGPFSMLAALSNEEERLIQFAMESYVARGKDWVRKLRQESPGLGADDILSLMDHNPRSKAIR